MPFPVRELLDRLEIAYGPPPERRGGDPIEELVSCILSQHTTDAISFPTFYELRIAFPTWPELVAGGPEKLAVIIRRTGLANRKARTIISCLELIHERVGAYSLEFLREMPPREARAWLTALPGVGPKTASIVLSFSLSMGVVAVDTHVYRVSQRLGLISTTTSADKAHDLLLDLIRPEDAYRFHMDLIVHGRSTCRAQKPNCMACAVRDSCAWLRSA